MKEGVMHFDNSHTQKFVYKANVHHTNYIIIEQEYNFNSVHPAD